MERSGPRRATRRFSPEQSAELARRDCRHGRPHPSRRRARTSTSTRRSSSPHVLFDVLGPAHLRPQEDQARLLLHQRQGLGRSRRATTPSWPRSSSTASARRSSRPTSTPCPPARARRRHASTRRSTRPSPPPAVFRARTPTCRTSPTRSELGHRVRQAFTVPAGQRVSCLRLLADRAAPARPPVAATSTWSPPSTARGRLPRRHGRARLRRAGRARSPPQLRSRAKAVNFGIVYGQQAFGLATSLKIPRAEAQRDDRPLLRGVPRRARLPRRVGRAWPSERGYAITMYGRKRHVPRRLPRASQPAASPSASAPP